MYTLRTIWKRLQIADRVIVIDDGKIIFDGTPKEVFSNVLEIKKIGLDVPQVTELFYELIKEGYKLPQNILDVDGAYEALAAELKLYEQ